MLSAVLAILGSGSFGSVVGLIGGLLNRKVDLESKKLDLQDKADERAHELKKMDSERTTMQAEYNMRLQVADKENEGKQIDADKETEVAGYGAMTASYDFAKPTPADGWVDKASKVIRPLLTIASVLFTGYVYVTINDMMSKLGVAPEPAKVVEIWILLIQWVLFQTGVIVGWWFAMRPGKHPPTP
ncbi:MAG TPA: hypothetical protein VIY48_10590 [Candidatus Paceibacterota bacterium]